MHGANTQARFFARRPFQSEVTKRRIGEWASRRSRHLSILALLYHVTIHRRHREFLISHLSGSSIIFTSCATIFSYASSISKNSSQERSRGETQTPRALEFRPPQSLRRLAWTQRLLHSVVYAMLQRYWRKPIVTIVGFDPLAHNALPTGISCSVRKRPDQLQAHSGKRPNRESAGRVFAPFRRFAVSPFRP